MESSTLRTEEETQHRQYLLNQMAVLQTQLNSLSSESRVVNAPPPTSPKRKQPHSTTLVPPTPSPKKRKISHHPPNTIQSGGRNARLPENSKAHTKPPAQPQFIKPAASNLLKSLANATNKQQESGRDAPMVRSSGFTEKPPAPVITDRIGQSSGLKRDENLTLVEELEPGPVEHIPPSDDPNFEKLEPNSGIRLFSRTVSHEDLQEHLTGRYYLSPSQLYSSIRLLPDKLGYDIPVPGDWITIAVVAERGPLRFTKAPVTAGRDDSDETEKKWKGKGKATEETTKPTGKKYINLKLIDFGSRSRSSSSATGGKAILRGDAFLSLLLFESDTFDLVSEDGESKPRKMYKGGSRGAFESMSKLKEGDVIALLNPRILKPYQRGNDSPHPVNNVLAITPESASSIMGIGRARDLGMCKVLKKDNTVCGSWVDKRVSDVCEYHVQHAVERRRAGRAEFSIGTTGLSTSSAPKRKPAYDPARQWGLKPETTVGNATYIVSGHVVNDSGVDARSLFATENIGREGQAKAARQMSKKAADRALVSLMERDKEGMKAVMKAREVSDVLKGGTDSTKGKGKDKKGQAQETSWKSKKEEVLPTGKNAYTAEVIKNLGFDPIAMAGQQRRGASDMDAQKKLRSLEALQSSRRNIVLGPQPGQRIRSVVSAPDKSALKEANLRDSDVEQDVMIDLDSDCN